MTSINIRGVGVEVSEPMRNAAQKSFDKLFARFSPVSHELTVKPAKGGVEIHVAYHFAKAHKVSIVSSDDFYSGINTARDQLIVQLKKAYPSQRDRRAPELAEVEQEEE